MIKGLHTMRALWGWCSIDSCSLWVCSTCGDAELSTFKTSVGVVSFTALSPVGGWGVWTSSADWTSGDLRCGGDAWTDLGWSWTRV